MNTLPKKLKHIICILSCVVSTFYGGINQSWSQDYKYFLRDQGEPLRLDTINSLPSKFEVETSKWSELSGNWRANLKFKSLQTLLEFSVNYNSNNTVAAGTYKLFYKLEGYENPTDTTQKQTINDSLVISYHPDSLAAYQHKNITHFSNFLKVRVSITGIARIDTSNQSNTPLTVSQIRNSNFQIKVGFIEHPYQLRHKLNNTYINAYGSSADPLSFVPPTATNDVLKLRWTLGTIPVDQFELNPANYELEWLYVDNYQVNTNGNISEKSAAEINYDFTNNATRVTLDTNYYELPLIYPKGYVVYRVRMVRPDSVRYRVPIYGKWNTNISGTIASIINTNNIYKITTSHKADSLNWQYTVSFAEQGKYKHVLSYYDGLLKNRQSITRFNSNPNQLIATEQIYDYEGRPSISILPTPIPTNRFTYQDSLALNKWTNKTVTASDFDRYNGIGCPEDTLGALAMLSKANIYYSSLNPDTIGYQKFVPNGQGYPLVQTIYSPGFADRIDKQGGAGMPLQIQEGHASQNFYVSADQADLNRMFGINIGNAGFYNKVVNKDPNGQLSLNYTDFKGNIIASSLVGIPDTLNTAIKMNDNVADTATFSENHLAGMPQQIQNNSKIFDKTYFNDVDGNNNLTYSSQFTPFFTGCPNKYLSVDINYLYTLINNCGQIKVTRNGQMGQTGVVNNGSPQTINEQNSVFLESGAYSIHKTLSFDPSKVTAAVNSFISDKDNCLKTEADFIKESVLSRSYDCQGACKTMCELHKETMMQELWPNLDGQYVTRKYGFYQITQQDSLTSNNNSIFTLVANDSNYIADIGTYDPSYNHYRYQDTCLVQLPDTVYAFGKAYTNLRSLPVDTFIKIFNNQIAEALLPLHPEYCELLKCVDDTFATTLDKLSTRAIANQYNIQTIEDIINLDPLFHSMSNQIGATLAQEQLMFLSGNNIDSLALRQAYCQSTDGGLYQRCIDTIFIEQINNHDLSNPYVYDSYYKNIIALYKGARQQYIQYLTPTNINCESCQNIRMTLIPFSVFNPTSTNTTNGGGTFNPFGNGNSSNASNGTGVTPTANYNVAQWPSNVPYPLIDTNGNNYTDTFNNALAIYNNTNATLNDGAINYILEKLQNCADSITLVQVKNKLLDLCISGTVQQGKFLPEHIRSAITQSGIALTDLCHPYLIDYTYLFDNSSIISQFSCNTELFYQDMNELINSDNFKKALRFPGTTYDLDIPNSYEFTQAINNTLGNNCEVKAEFTPTDHMYTVYLFKNNQSDTIRFFFRMPDSIVATSNSPFHLNGNEGIEIETICLKDIPYGEYNSNNHNTGFIYNYSFGIKIVKTDAIGNSTTKFVPAWNSLVPINLYNNSNIAQGIPIPELIRHYNIAMDTLNTFNIKQVDHPYFKKSLTNILNYHFKRTYSFEQYWDVLQSGALADHVKVPLQNIYVTIGFNNVTNLNAFIQAFNNLDSNTTFVAALRTKNSSNQEFVMIDFNAFPVANWGTYKNFINQYSTGVISKLINQPATNIFNDTNIVTTWWVPNTVNTNSLVTNIQNNTGLVVTNTGIQNIYNGISYLPYKVLSIKPTTSQTSQQISNKLYWISRFIQTNVPSSFTIDRYYSTADSVYSTTHKYAFLQKMDTLKNESTATVLNEMDPSVLSTTLTPFNGYHLTYGTQQFPNQINNLFYIHQTNGTVGTKFSVLQTIINAARTHYGNNRIFGLAPNINVLPNNQLVCKVTADKSKIWYRYFGAQDTLYNVFLNNPWILPLEQLQTYQYQSIELVPGNNQTQDFKIKLYKQGGFPEYITLEGTTDFIIGKNDVLRDILLPDPSKNDTIAYLNCEQQILQNAIQEGRINYLNYIDSVRTHLTSAFTAHLLGNGITETLTTSYKTQRFNYTLYQYDRAQNLIATIPPAGVKFIESQNLLTQIDSIRNADTLIDSLIPTHRKTSNYLYNTLNQVVKQITPDGGATRFFYNRAGQAIFSQNDVQKETGYMTYTLYDAQNRIIETGQTQIAKTPHFDPVPATVPNANFSYGYLVGGYYTPYPPIVHNMTTEEIITNDSITKYIRNQARKEVTLTQYDSAALQLGAIAGMSDQENLRQRVAAVKYFDDLNANGNINDYKYAMHFSYDAVGNVKTLTRDYPNWKNTSQQFKRIDYDYDLISGKVNLLSYNRSFGDQFYQKYDYDADNRIKEVLTSNDGIIWNRDATYEYYQHGPLARVSLGQERVQGVDYAYTIQGWLKAINGDILNPERDMGQDGYNNNAHAQDAMAFAIDYFNGDYMPIAGNVIQNPAGIQKNLFNGNIPRTSIDLKPFKGLATDYTYDQLNRLLKSEYAYLDTAQGLIPTQQYYNSYAYDADGNLKKLVRNGDLINNLRMDSIVYHYTSNDNNKLLYINDYAVDNYSNDIKYNVTQNLNSYLYDKAGNLVKDLVGGQDSILWNHNNKVTKVLQNNGDSTTLAFEYDGMGQRFIKSKVINKADTTLSEDEYYVRDAQGNILATYKAKNRYEKELNTSWTSYFDNVGQVAVPSSSLQFLSTFIIPAFGNNNSFVTQLITDAVNSGSQDFSSGADNPSFFLENNPTIYQNFFYSANYSRLLFPYLREYAYDIRNVPILEQAFIDRYELEINHEDDDIRNNGVLKEIFTKAFVEQEEAYLKRPFANAVANMANNAAQQIADNIGLPFDPSNTEEFEITFLDKISDGEKELVFDELKGVIDADIDVRNSFFHNIASHTTINNMEFFEQFPSILETFQHTMASWGYHPDLQDLVDSWAESKFAMEQITTPKDIAWTIWSTNPLDFLKNTIIVSNSYDIIANAAAASLGGQNFNQLNNLLGQFQIAVPTYTLVNNLKSQELYLSSHHLYGSSRLGTKEYFPHQYYLRMNATTNPVTRDTLNLLARRPWYSIAYDDVIEGLSLSPWSKAEQQKFTVADQIGLKQYELTNHLGNVQATISDLPFKKGPIDGPNGLIPGNKQPALAAAYDYYPFGMLMPGRYTSDTSNRNMTITQSKWTIRNVTVCDPGIATANNFALIGGATISQWSSNQVLLNSTSDSSIVAIQPNVVPGVENTILFDFKFLEYNPESKPTIVRAVEEINGKLVTIASITVLPNVRNSISFIPSTSNTTLQILHPSSVLTGPFCTTYPQAVQENYLVNIINNSQDRYRFGFNGQEKVNEIAGVGNHVDLGERGLDTRIGRLNWKPDPLAHKFPYQSPYVYAGNSPILNIDKNGEYKYPKNMEKEYRKQYPMITLYFEHYIKHDVEKSTRLTEGILLHANNPKFGKSELFNEILTWSKDSRTEIVFGDGLMGNANTVNSKRVLINSDYAKSVENILGDRDRTYTAKEKQNAITAFFITMMDETTLVGSKYNPDPKFSEGGSDGDVGNDLVDEIFYEADGVKGNYRVYQADKDNIHQTEEVIKNIKKEGRSDVLPTTPNQ